jgi:ABC-2 type transport system permease protein
MEALKGAAQNMSLLDLAEPLSILILIGVLCMGVGINLMERRKV